MTVKTLMATGVSQSGIARMLGVTEGAVRYQVKRMQAGAVDGRGSGQKPKAEPFAAAIEHWHAQQDEGRVNLAALHEWLVAEHGYTGSLRSVERFCRKVYPAPAIRARRRVETPPGAQSQVDWAEFPRVVVAGECIKLLALHMVLSHSRFAAVIWSPRKDQLSWLHCHTEAFKRVGGVTATVRVDNEKTAICRGAGAWGTINPTYRRYATMMRFHVDACPPRQPRAKGKVERRIRDQRLRIDPSREAWRDLGELQAWTDERMQISARRRRCPVTGLSVWDSWQAERALLGALPETLPEPFDVALTRPVNIDGLVSFEGRQYGVPIRFVGSAVEVRGCANSVQILGDSQVVAVYERGTQERLLIDPAHYDGPGTDRVIAPPPLGRMGRRLLEIGQMPVERRPLDLYAALSEVAR